MNRAIGVLTEDVASAERLHAWLVKIPQGRDAVRFVVGASDADAITERFDRAATWVEAQMARGRDAAGIPHAVILTNLEARSSLEDLDPTRGAGFNPLLGMLILAYPEVDWIFAEASTTVADAGSPDNRLDLARLRTRFGGGPTKLRQALDRFSGDLSPIFDGTGLRNRVRAATEGGTRPRGRARTFVAVDEEPSYAWLHAYIAYRFDYLAEAVTTLGGLVRAKPADAEPPDVVFEDVCVEFPDGEGPMDVQRRGEAFPWLREGHHVFVTSGAPTADPELQAGLAAAVRLPLAKPIGGVFDVAREANLPRTSTSVAAGAKAPPDTTTGATSDALSHAAPGRLLLVAERLISRARRLLASVESAPSACHGAVLATDAIELLAARTPTLALEALALKHEFELLAECQFLGMRQLMRLEPRLEEIKRAVCETTAHHGDRPAQRRSAWNAELAICNRLLNLLRENNRFDEENAVLGQTQILRLQLWLDRNDAWYLIRAPAALVALYMAILVRSVRNFVTIIVLLLLGLGGLFMLLAGDGRDQVCRSVGVAWAHADPLAPQTWLPGAAAYVRGLTEATLTFIATQPSDPSCVWAAHDGLTWGLVLVAGTIAAGLLHLGVLISQIYSLMMRR